MPWKKNTTPRARRGRRLFDGKAHVGRALHDAIECAYYHRTCPCTRTSHSSLASCHWRSRDPARTSEVAWSARRIDPRRRRMVQLDGPSPWTLLGVHGRCSPRPGRSAPVVGLGGPIRTAVCSCGSLRRDGRGALEPRLLGRRRKRSGGSFRSARDRRLAIALAGNGSWSLDRLLGLSYPMALACLARSHGVGVLWHWDCAR